MSEIQNQSASQTLCKRSKFHIRGAREIRQEGEHLVRVLRHGVLDRRVVHLANLRRDIVKQLVSTQIPARHRTPLFFRQLLLGLFALECLIEVILSAAPARRAQAFPESPASPEPEPSSSVGAEAAHNSSMIASGLRWLLS